MLQKNNKSAKPSSPLFDGSNSCVMGYCVKISFIACLGILLLAGCRKKEDKIADSPEIDGYVVEDPGGMPVPYAYVTIGKEWFEDGAWISSRELVDTVRADANGHFRLDRKFYQQISDHYNCGCWFIACGRGPVTPEGADYYSSTCDATTFDPYADNNIYCYSKTLGYINVRVDGTPPMNAEYTHIGFEVATPSFSEFGNYYPVPNYNIDEGATYGPFYEGMHISVELRFSNSEGFFEELFQTQEVNIVAKDTVHVVFQY
jgi:hypothetical protein